MSKVAGTHVETSSTWSDELSIEKSLIDFRGESNELANNTSMNSQTSNSLVNYTSLSTPVVISNCDNNILNKITTNEVINDQLVEIRKIHHDNYIKKTY